MVHLDGRFVSGYISEMQETQDESKLIMENGKIPGWDVG
jgi:hypothetical protein